MVHRNGNTRTVSQAAVIVRALFSLVVQRNKKKKWMYIRLKFTSEDGTVLYLTSDRIRTIFGLIDAMMEDFHEEVTREFPKDGSFGTTIEGGVPTLSIDLPLSCASFSDSQVVVLWKSFCESAFGEYAIEEVARNGSILPWPPIDTKKVNHFRTDCIFAGAIAWCVRCSDFLQCDTVISGMQSTVLRLYDTAIETDTDNYTGVVTDRVDSALINRAFFDCILECGLVSGFMYNALSKACFGIGDRPTVEHFLEYARSWHLANKKPPIDYLNFVNKTSIVSASVPLH